MKHCWFPLGVAIATAILQQQLLLNKPPRLIKIEPISAGRESAAIRMRFSRSMDGSSLRKEVKIMPKTAYQLLGKGNSWSLYIKTKQPITASFKLEVGGKDRRGLGLKSELWLWDPRPILVAARPVVGGDQIQSWSRNKWQPLSPVRGKVLAMLPLGNGAGIASVINAKPMASEVWSLMLSNQAKPLLENQLNKHPLIFAALSTDQQGDLLVQFSTPTQPGSKVDLWRMIDLQLHQPARLGLEATGPIQLVPQGHQVVIPEFDGLSLQNLPPLAPKREVLPGSRDLSSFCPQPGRAILVRHWPDYRRSVELLEPGKTPKQLWLGQEAVLATACAGGGERVWVLLLSGIKAPLLELLEINKQAKVARKVLLRDLELDPGSKLHYDVSRQKLLLLLRPKTNNYQQPLPAQIHLINLENYAIEVIPGSATHAGWLPSRQLKKI
jgi:hypothetical protein